jgi:hypothetical protein
VYVGGAFSNVGGKARTNLGAVGADGAGTNWDPAVNGPVNAIALAGSTVYAGGSFSSAGGAAAANLVALGADGLALPGAGTDGPVNALTTSSTHLYVGGQFGALGGQARANLGAVELASGAVGAFAPGTSGSVSSLTVNSTGSTVYAAGTFTSAGGQARLRAAAFTSAGALTGWDPRAEATVNTVALSGGAVLAGGDFAMLNGYPRRNAAAIRADGSVDPAWDPSPDNTVYAAAVSPDGATVYLGGTFTTVGTTAKTYLAAVNSTTGALNPNWLKATNNTVRAIATSGDYVYAGGSFTRAGGGDAIRLAKLTAANGTAVPGFVSSPNNTVRALVVSPDGSKLYAVGGFNGVNNVSRPGAAEVSTATGALTSFAPDTGGAGIAAGLTPDGTRFFFSTSSNRTYAYDPAVSNTPVYTFRTGGDVQAIGVSATEVYVGGHFANLPVEHLARLHAAAFLVSTGQSTAWDPAPDGTYGVWAISVTANSVVIGGDFAKVGGKAQPGFARFAGTP